MNSSNTPINNSVLISARLWAKNNPTKNMFDSLILFTASFGYLIVILLCLIKFYLLLWYKPGNFSFAIKNFIVLQSRITRSTREMDNPKFPYLKKSYTRISLVIYFFLVVWILFFILVHIANPR